MKRKNIWRNLSVGMLFAALPLIAVLPLKSGNDEPAAVRPPVVRMYQYKFPGATENVLTDSASSLRPFFDRLRALEDGDRDSSPVSICHVGDSHIQADYQTGLIRRMFQDFFGNAGRGLIVPLRLAKTNEPRNYRISSSGKWEGIRCIKPGKYPVGIGGMVLVGNDSVSSVKIQTLDLYNPHKWSFNQITVFYDTCRVELSAGDSVKPPPFQNNSR